MQQRARGHSRRLMTEELALDFNEQHCHTPPSITNIPTEIYI